MSEAKLSEADLRHFTGSENWWRHGIARNVLFTDGAHRFRFLPGCFEAKLDLPPLPLRDRQRHRTHARRSQDEIAQGSVSERAVEPE